MDEEYNQSYIVPTDYPPRSTVLFAILNSLSTGLNNTVLVMIRCPFNQQTVN